MEGKNNRPKTQIPYSHFLDIWSGLHRHNPNYAHYYNSNNDAVQIMNIQVLGEALYIRKENLPQLTLISCEIDYLIISSSNIEGIILKDTIILNNIIIQHNSQIQELEISNGSTVNSVQNTSSQIRFFSITDSSVNQITNINEAKIDEFNIYKSQVKFLSIARISQLVRLFITKSHFEHILCTNSFINDIIIGQNSQIRLLNIADNMNVNAFLIDNRCEISSFSINDSNIYDITLSKSIFDSILIEGAKLNKVKFEKLEKLSTLTSSESYFENFTISTQKLTSAIFKKTIFYILDIVDSQLPKESYLSISNSQLNKLKISNSLFGGTFMLNTISPITELDRFIEYPEGPYAKEFKEFEFRKVTENSLFKIVEIDLGKAQFIGSDFSQFTNFEYKSSKILELFVADTILPARQNIYHPDKEATPAQILEQQRLALSQFKKIYENRGDSVRATQALAEEMETYRAQLKLEKPATKKERWNNRTERLNLWLNRISNYHGNNWFRGMLVTLGVNSVLFMLYSLSIGNRPGTDVGRFFTLAAYSFEFLNPLRKAEFLKHGLPGECEGLSVFIDYTSRIIIAYFVYQTIAAFRKFGKRAS